MQATNNKIFGTYFKRIFKYLLFGVNIFTLLLLFSLFLVWNISPAKVTFLAYIGLATPFILIANILFLIFWFISGNWKLGIFNLICLLICYSPISTYFPLKSRDSSVPEGSIKILSYNVRGFNWRTDQKWEKNPIYTYLKATDADIVCMQEYMASTSQQFSTSKKLQKALGYPYYSVTPLRSTKGGYEYGLACFSKFPIIEVKKIPIVTTDNGSVMYKLNINGKVVTLINNHLESNRLTLADKKLYRKFFKGPNSEALDEVAQNIEDKLGKAYKKRAPQVELLEKYIEEQNTDAVIVCGDFNDTPISYTYHTIKKNLVDSYTETGFGPGITYHENHFWFKIDFIMHSKNMKAYNFTIDKVKYSDHYPVWTYLHFQ